MDAYKATAGNKLTAICAARSQPVKHLDKTRASMLAVYERPVKTTNVNIYRNQDSGYEESKRDIKHAAAAVQAEEHAKHDEDEESGRCRKTKDEEQDRDTYADRNFNEAPSLDFRSFRIHARVRMTPYILLSRRPCRVACTARCTGDLSDPGFYHAFMKADLRISIKDYRRNKSLNVQLLQVPGAETHWPTPGGWL